MASGRTEAFGRRKAGNPVGRESRRYCLEVVASDGSYTREAPAGRGGLLRDRHAGPAGGRARGYGEIRDIIEGGDLDPRTHCLTCHTITEYLELERVPLLDGIRSLLTITTTRS